MRIAPIVAMMLAAPLAGPVAAQRVSPPAGACPTVAIDSATMLRDVFRLADDSMRGRRVGTPQDAKARDFIAARFDALGVLPTDSGRVLPFDVRQRSGVVRGFNVAGIIRGTRYPEQYIAVTAHFDHIGTASGGQCAAIGADSICNGADDNASGTAGMLALARHFEQHPPEHSLLLVAFDAEEAGDLGSRALVSAPPVPLTEILIDVNLDMVGRNVHNQLYASGPGKFPRLRPMIDAGIRCAGITLTVGHDGSDRLDDWTDQSDQGAFNARGIPFVYFGEEDHPDYHKAGDQAERLMPAFYVGAVRAVADFIRRFDAGPISRQGADRTR